ncbi:ABC transporter permease [Conexibacter woesei]|uniref:Binding-protein-dependent transport systems inner membrane component n=1 Tax=Conexibacter woesei (strain DSM 14684 / CCUG 47730 / CIP 108061 / JCM 11494 / NBRC 100937 / ID131577) TaxID=469383 RepID=D3F7R2_CONWI|nr:ABC transporter permease [Conexibacter woesei]ADB50924.1 binding-protein-dependent transport systems inner membrane component [Conexibacter woesei DSM 14684]
MTLDYALRRIAFFVVVVWITVTAMFFLVRLAPGDPITDQVTRMQASGQALAAGPELIEEYRRQFGLDKPMVEQYFSYLKQLAQGDLGYSVTNFPTRVTTLIGDALPWTLGLLFSAIVISWVVGSLLGGLMAWRTTPAIARGLMSSLMLFAAIPYYLVALLLLYVFAYELQWLPTGGAQDPLGTSGGAFAQVADVLEHALLPAASIVLAFVGIWMIGMRSMMISVLGSDHLLLAEAKGLPQRRIFTRYAMHPAILPQVTTLAIYIGYVVAGSILVEVLFSYPGLGKVLVAAVDARDYPVIQGVVLMMVVTTAGALLILDLIYPLIDPRIRYGRD